MYTSRTCKGNIFINLLYNDLLIVKIENIIYIKYFFFLIFKQHVIGGGGIGLFPSITKKGFKDGNFTEALFHSPQGICFQNSHIIFVCDTENHAIRMVTTKHSIKIFDIFSYLKLKSIFT